jgi:hypothetical protein
MHINFQSEVIYWRGPAPFFYATLPPAEAKAVRVVAKRVTYGWGVIPVEAEVGGVRFTTSLFPKDETYLLPLKAAVRKQINVTAGDVVSAQLWLAVESG